MIIDNTGADQSLPAPNKPSDPPKGPPPKRRPAGLMKRTALAAALLGACAAGAGATVIAEHGRRPVLVSLTPVPIAAMKDWSAVAVKGTVSEVFGNHFILADGSGHALVDAGPQGEGVTLVAPAEAVTVQGRFDHGSVHALAIQHADGRTDMVGPPGPPPPGPPGWPHHDGEPRGGADRPS